MKSLRRILNMDVLGRKAVSDPPTGTATNSCWRES
jgi:hypothetical protein